MKGQFATRVLSLSPEMMSLAATEHRLLGRAGHLQPLLVEEEGRGLLTCPVSWECPSLGLSYLKLLGQLSLLLSLPSSTDLFQRKGLDCS